MAKRAKPFPSPIKNAKNAGHGTYKAKRHPGSKVNKPK